MDSLWVGLGMGFAQGGTILFFVALAERYKQKNAQKALSSLSENVERFRKAFADELAAAPTQRPPRDLS